MCDINSRPIIATALDQAMAAMGAYVAQQVLTNPQGTVDALTQLSQTLFGTQQHTGYECIQDLWDAVEAGHLSHGAALNATAILAADLERQRQRPADQPPQQRPQPQTIPTSPLDLIRTWPEYHHR